MKIEKIQSTVNFGKLYMPSKESLASFGREFAEKAEPQRGMLKKIADKADIYVTPKVNRSVKDQNFALFNVVKPHISTMLNHKFEQLPSYFEVKTVCNNTVKQFVANAEDLYSAVASQIHEGNEKVDM